MGDIGRCRSDKGRTAVRTSARQTQKPEDSVSNYTIQVSEPGADSGDKHLQGGRTDRVRDSQGMNYDKLVQPHTFGLQEETGTPRGNMARLTVTPALDSPAAQHGPYHMLCLCPG